MPKGTAISVFWSASAPQPKLHITPRCAGLERVIVAPEHHRTFTSASIPSLWDLAKVTSGEYKPRARALAYAADVALDPLRPCRHCALEAVIDAALSRPGPKSFVTFSALPSHSADSRRYDRKDVTDSSVQRLQRIAQRAGLGITVSRIGPAAYGLVPAEAVGVLKANLRTITGPPNQVPDSRAVSIVWSLVDDSPSGDRPNGDFDLWELASLV